MLHVCSAVNYYMVVACNLKIEVIVLKGKTRKTGVYFYTNAPINLKL